MDTLSSAVFKRNEMTLLELLNKVNTEKPNSFSNEYLMNLVNEVEAQVYDYLETPESMRIYHVLSEIETVEEPEDIGLDGELLIPDPYSTSVRGSTMRTKSSIYMRTTRSSSIQTWIPGRHTQCGTAR